VKSAYVRYALPVALSAVLLVGYAWLRFGILKFASPQSTTSTLGQRIVDTGQAFAEYIRLIFLPTGLHMERTLTGVPGWIAILGYLLLALCVVPFFAGLRRGHYRVSLGIGWFLLTWFPVSGLIPLNAPMAEHWMYVPLAGFLLALSEWLWQHLHNAPSRQLAAVAVFAGLLLFVGLSVHRNRDWKDNESIYLATLAKSPESIRARYNLATTYEFVKPNPAAAKREYENLLAVYDKMRRESGQDLTWDQEREAHVSLGRLLSQEGRDAEAIGQFTKALEASSGRQADRTVTAALLGRGKAFLAVGDVNDALRDLEASISQDPSKRSEVALLVRDALLLGTS
jgi:tetratricopeptide (TPR) repeat protein